MISNSVTSLERLIAGLPRIGFARAPGGGFRRDDLHLRLNKPWLTLQLPLAGGDSVEPLLGWLNRPGLWKFARTADGFAKRFDLPIDSLLAADNLDDVDTPPVLQSVVDWALATRWHGLPARDVGIPTHQPGFPLTERCTANHGLEARATTDWAGPAGLPLAQRDMVLQHDRYICRGEIINDGARLALRMPVLRRFRGELSESRKAWLRELLATAQERCPMVRLGLDSAEAAIDAVVDLTGCPAGLVDTIIQTGRDALCWTVAWLVSSVDLVADPDVVSEALQVCPARA